MAAVLGHTEVGVEEFGRDIIVPDDPKARLMYYVDSIYSVLDMTDIRNIQKLRYVITIFWNQSTITRAFLELRRTLTCTVTSLYFIKVDLCFSSSDKLLKSGTYVTFSKL